MKVKKIIRSMVRGLGYEIRNVNAPKESALIRFLRDRRVDLVFDVGANVGQFGLELRKGGYSGRIVSFEPILEVFRSLEHASRNDPAWEVHNFAIGSGDSCMEINVSHRTDFTSFKVLNEHSEQFANSGVVRRELVQVRRLDEVIKHYTFSSGFLKVDTQGFEQPVLEGAPESLPRLAGIQIEIPITPIYNDVWNLEEAVSFLRRRGFTVANLYPVNFDKLDKVSLLEIDAIFKNDRMKRKTTAIASGAEAAPLC